MGKAKVVVPKIKRSGYSQIGVCLFFSESSQETVWSYERGTASAAAAVVAIGVAPRKVGCGH